ncbi:LPS export ABC transporter periplasmic protein LptC [Candidatus Pelagibacter sp.]|jgi:LPS export ABC transporter protein LptC|nr:LPS export ABC transporter periplasmic protein LptC [Candidatus Pelagibacter sp.]|tara:strand:- start:51 stop:632 length:582 start_codon:yes stop_codon:yes gene_type:complete
MNKKTVIQVLIIFLTLLISWLFFLKYFDKNKKIAQDIIIKKENVLENASSNFIENISYDSEDLKENKYKITARQAEIDIDNPDVMFLDNVIAYVYLKDSETIKITSDFGKYNSKNYDTIFSKNVIVTYPGHKITGEYLDFSLLRDLGTMSTNVIYTGNKNELFADMIEMNISTKDTKIFMNDNKKDVIIKGSN